MSVVDWCICGKTGGVRVGRWSVMPDRQARKASKIRWVVSRRDRPGWKAGGYACKSHGKGGIKQLGERKQLGWASVFGQAGGQAGGGWLL